MFSLVHFVQEDELEVIRSGWMIDNETCLWPPYTSESKIKKTVINAPEPDSSWTVCNIAVLGTYDSYEKASEELLIAENFVTHESDVEAEKSSLKRKQDVLLLSDSSESEDFDINTTNPNKKKKLSVDLPLLTQVDKTIPTPRISITTETSGVSLTEKSSPVSSSSLLTPLLQREHTVLKKRKLPPDFSLPNQSDQAALSSPRLQIKAELLDVDPAEISSTPLAADSTELHIQSPDMITLEQLTSLSSQIGQPEVQSERGYVEVRPIETSYPRLTHSSQFNQSTQKQLLCMLEDIRQTLEQHTALLQQILERQGTAEYRNPVRIVDLPTLPLRKEEDLQNWEKYIHNDSNLKKAITYFGCQGGSNVFQATRRILKIIISNELASTYNWAGRGDKKPFKELKTNVLILCAVKENPKLKYVNAKDIEDATKSWLKYAPIRMTHSIFKKK